MTSVLVLDAGALIAIGRDDRGTAVLLESAARRGARVVVPASALAQVWRDGARQARLARFLKVRRPSEANLDAPTARVVGALCGATGTRDIVDAHVVVVARTQESRQATILTSDPDDLRRLDPGARIVAV